MSYDSLLRNREYMGYGALTGLFRESKTQPPYAYTRDQQRLRQWQQSNAENNTAQDRTLKYLSTAWNSLQHLCIYWITPKFHLLKSKCKAIANHMDAASLCIIMFAMFTLFIILLSRFIVDYEDIHSKPTPIIDNIQDTIHNDQLINNTHSPPHYDIHTIYNDEVVEEYDTIDNLFKPTPIPIIEEEEEPEDEDIVSDTIFNQWILIHSVHWNKIKTGQIMKIKHIKKNIVFTVMIVSIDLFKMNIGIEYENCWIFCHEIIDIIASHRMIYLIQSPINIDSDTITNEINHENNNGNNEMDTGHTTIQFDATPLYESISKIHDDHDEFKQWVHSQVNQIQQSNDEFKDVLTDYLDDKMTKMLSMLQAQQNVIQSIQTHQQQQVHYVVNNQSIEDETPLHWDWDSIENRMDNKIESVVKVQLEEKFGSLAQEIGQEIAKEIAAQHINDGGNSHIIKGNDDEHNDNEFDRKKNIETDWAQRVVSHSKLKTNNDDILHEYGHWIMHNLLSKWNQEAISTTYKPGDCTPLAFERNNGYSESYIKIELYQAVDVKRVSLYHYHSAILTQTAINAAPKDFQIWASYNLSKWYDLGNFSYDYYDEKHTQYFDVVDIAQRKSNQQDNVDVDQDSQIIKNDTTIVTDNGGYDDYKMGFKYIAFRLLSNYGGSDYGCIYRLRIFGDAVAAIS